MSGRAFSGRETFQYELYHHAKGRFAAAQEMLFQTAKSSQIFIAVPQVGRFVDVQESRTQVEKRQIWALPS